jgi:Fe-S-cluster containining protein
MSDEKKNEPLFPPLMEKEGYPYRFDPNACGTCGGACCTGESGYIWVKQAEMESMADFLELDFADFAKIYIRKVGHRYSLREKRRMENDYACIFFDEKRECCAIYPVRPVQCRTFPFWEQFRKNEKEVRKECPGII